MVANTVAERPDGAQDPASVPVASSRPQPPAPGPQHGLVRVFTGHYGGGKTEVAVSLAMTLAATGRAVSLADLDVVNPYFRSRERADLLTAAGVEVISSSLGHNITLDLPAISLQVREPLADPTKDVILDIGGNEVGARVLAGFRADLVRRGCRVLLVVNAYRPDTRDVAGVLAHLRAIETIAEMPVTGLVSNTHLLRQTTVEDVVAGYRLTLAVSERTGIPIEFVCGIPQSLEGLDARLGAGRQGDLLPIGLYLRDPWM